jgi:hypothetical protein
MSVHPLRARIQAYTEKVRAKDIHCSLDRCPRCTLESVFKRHDRRKRTFLLIVGDLVERVDSLLTRWKCVLCERTFSLYPSFALPHKHYVRPTIFERGQSYLDDEDASYRRAIQIEGMPVFYAGESEERIDERTLAPSTLYRWLTSLGGLERTVREALRLIRSASPKATIFRTTYPVPPRKYRSPERKKRLQLGRQLFETERVYRPLFGASIFPHLATACAFR